MTSLHLDDSHHRFDLTLADTRPLEAGSRECFDKIGAPPGYPAQHRRAAVALARETMPHATAAAALTASGLVFPLAARSASVLPCDAVRRSP